MQKPQTFDTCTSIIDIHDNICFVYRTYETCIIQS